MAEGAASAAGELLDPGFMRRLDQLAMLSRKVFRGQRKGERRSRKKLLDLKTFSVQGEPERNNSIKTRKKFRSIDETVTLDSVV